MEISVAEIFSRKLKLSTNEAQSATDEVQKIAADAKRTVGKARKAANKARKAVNEAPRAASNKAKKATIEALRAAKEALKAAIEAQKAADEAEIEGIRNIHARKEEIILFMRFPHLASQIFGELDNQTLLKCRKVNESWKQGNLLKGTDNKTVRRLQTLLGCYI